MNNPLNRRIESIRRMGAQCFDAGNIPGGSYAPGSPEHEAYVAGWTARKAEVEDDYDDSYPPACSSRAGHSWVVRDDNEEVSYCEHCGADGNA